MRPQANFTRQLAIIAVFAASCVLILVYLWTSFGGSIPLKPKSYRVSADFPEASNLTLNADVRISGVTVGHVVAKNAASDGTTHTVLELEPQYAPLPANARAMLRQKTIVGEIYVDLTPGDASGPKLPEGGIDPEGADLPERRARRDLPGVRPEDAGRVRRRWFQNQAAGVQGRGRDLNDAIGNTPAFAQDTDQLLQHPQLAGRRRPASSSATPARSSTRSRSAAASCAARSRTGTRCCGRPRAATRRSRGRSRRCRPSRRRARPRWQRLAAFSKKANPVITQLRPVARALGPTLQEVDAIAPDFEALMRGIGPLVDASKQGLPATQALPRRAARRPRRLPAGAHAAQPVLRLHRGAQGRLRGVHRQRDGRDAGLVRSRRRRSRGALPASDDRHWVRVRSASTPSDRAGLARTRIR